MTDLLLCKKEEEKNIVYIIHFINDISAGGYCHLASLPVGLYKLFIK